MLAVVFMTLIGPGPEKQSTLSTTYSAGANGVKAFYTLLGDRLGRKVERLLDPYTDMPRGAAALVVVAPLKEVPISVEESAALEEWIGAGGTAIFISDSLANVPARFGSTRGFGKGRIYALSSAKVISNKGMRDYRNAVKLLNMIAEHVPVPNEARQDASEGFLHRSSLPSKPMLRGKQPPEASVSSDLILFDEYHHGLGRSQAQGVLAHAARQVKIGAVVIAVALLALCYGRGRRFGAVRNLPSWEGRRPGFEFVESVARLYERAGAADLAAEILVKSMRQGLCLKLGLSPDAPSETIVRQLESDGRRETAQKVDRLLTLHAGQKLSKSELVYIAREIHSIENELGIRTL
ncbi:MAG: DUF4350 domain-containing protein [Chloroflexi bacterium]|nr:DUF4350 domain-containing protein [Chloroflexota bacterium]